MQILRGLYEKDDEQTNYCSVYVYMAYSLVNKSYRFQTFFWKTTFREILFVAQAQIISENISGQNRVIAVAVTDMVNSLF